MFDVLILGGGVSSMSCALVLGSAHKKAFVNGKKIGVITHQKSSNLQEALFNNAYGIVPGTLGKDLLESSTEHLKNMYPHVEQIPDQKVVAVIKQDDYFLVKTNKEEFKSKLVVVGVGASNLFNIDGLNEYVIPHKKIVPEKNRIQLKNDDHLVMPGVYVVGVLAGWRSQLAIASGSGAAVATDILTLWNSGIHTQSHDSIKKS